MGKGSFGKVYGTSTYAVKHMELESKREANNEIHIMNNFKNMIEIVGLVDNGCYVKRNTIDLKMYRYESEFF